MQALEGIFTPLATAFTDDGLSLSEIRFARQIRYLLEQPIAGFIACTDCGEFTSLSRSERKDIVEWLARYAAGKPFIVHVSSLSTAVSLDLAQHAARHGARAVVLMPPYYGSFTADELVSFFRSVAQYGNIPVIAVDPQEQITAEVKESLQEVPDLLFALPLEQAQHAHLSCDKGLATADEFALGQLVVSPLALLRPQQVSQAVHGEVADLTKLMILEETLGCARVSKAGLEALGYEMGPPRPPLKSLSGAVGVALKTLLQI